MAGGQGRGEPRAELHMGWGQGVGGWLGLASESVMSQVSSSQCSPAFRFWPLKVSKACRLHGALLCLFRGCWRLFLAPGCGAVAPQCC